MKCTILIVDDNPDTRILLQLMLKPVAEEILHAEDGFQAIEVAQQHLPDIIITDLMMPGMDGVEVCLTLRKDETTAVIPIILLTAKHDFVPPASEQGHLFDAVLFKPAARTELLNTVAAAFSPPPDPPASASDPITANPL